MSDKDTIDDESNLIIKKMIAGFDEKSRISGIDAHFKLERYRADSEKFMDIVFSEASSDKIRDSLTYMKDSLKNITFNDLFNLEDEDDEKLKNVRYRQFELTGALINLGTYYEQNKTNQSVIKLTRHITILTIIIAILTFAMLIISYLTYSTRIS